MSGIPDYEGTLSARSSHGGGGMPLKTVDSVPQQRDTCHRAESYFRMLRY